MADPQLRVIPIKAALNSHIYGKLASEPKMIALYAAPIVSKGTAVPMRSSQSGAALTGATEPLSTD